MLFADHSWLREGAKVGQLQKGHWLCQAHQTSECYCSFCPWRSAGQRPSPRMNGGGTQMVSVLDLKITEGIVFLSGWKLGPYICQTNDLKDIYLFSALSETNFSNILETINTSNVSNTAVQIVQHKQEIVNPLAYQIQINCTLKRISGQRFCFTNMQTK